MIAAAEREPWPRVRLPNGRRAAEGAAGWASERVAGGTPAGRASERGCGRTRWPWGRERRRRRRRERGRGPWPAAAGRRSGGTGRRGPVGATWRWREWGMSVEASAQGLEAAAARERARADAGARGQPGQPGLRCWPKIRVVAEEVRLSRAQTKGCCWRPRWRGRSRSGATGAGSVRKRLPGKGGRLRRRLRRTETGRREKGTGEAEHR